MGNLVFCFFFVSSDHSKGSHGMAGLYFKYDVSALKVIVKSDQEGFMHFLIRLSSIIAGIIVISGIRYSSGSNFEHDNTFDVKSQQLNVSWTIFLFSGYLNSLIQLMCDFFIRKLSPQTYQQLHNENTSTNTPYATPPPPSQPANWQNPNNLISNANQMAEANFNFTINQETKTI